MNISSQCNDGKEVQFELKGLDLQYSIHVAKLSSCDAAQGDLSQIQATLTSSDGRYHP